MQPSCASQRYAPAGAQVGTSVARLCDLLFGSSFSVHVIDKAEALQLAADSRLQDILNMVSLGGSPTFKVSDVIDDALFANEVREGAHAG